jgi:hypothetical protein
MRVRREHINVITGGFVALVIVVQPCSHRHFTALGVALHAVRTAVNVADQVVQNATTP